MIEVEGVFIEMEERGEKPTYDDLMKLINSGVEIPESEDFFILYDGVIAKSVKNINHIIKYKTYRSEENPDKVRSSVIEIALTYQEISDYYSSIKENNYHVIDYLPTLKHSRIFIIHTKSKYRFNYYEVTNNFSDGECIYMTDKRYRVQKIKLIDYEYHDYI